MSVLNYTTSIPVEKTIGEMQKMLASHGASRISIDYDLAATPTGLSFELKTPHGLRVFNLPVDVQKMQNLLIYKDGQGQLKSGSRAQRTSIDQAERTAWRVMKDWLSAQLTLVSLEMMSLDQVMLPYLNMNGRSLYQAYREQEQQLLALDG